MSPGTPVQAKAEALKWAVLSLIELNMSNVIIEEDNQNIRPVLLDSLENSKSLVKDIQLLWMQQIKTSLSTEFQEKQILSGSGRMAH